MKYVYVLVSDEKDYYLEECLISMVSLRKHDSAANIILIMDDRTEKSLTGFRKMVREEASRVIVRQFEETVSAKVRSRLLKTSLRRLVEGCFLFIDSDTVIVDTLDLPENKDMVLGMVLDKHMRISEHYMDKYIHNNAKKLSYSEGYQGRHFNSGVIYVGDDEIAYRFFDLWHQLYLESMKQGIEVDQTSLNEANARMHGVITELDGKWNVQINCGMKYLSEAKILHYLGYQPTNAQNIYFNSLPFQLCDTKYFDEMRRQQGITGDILQILEHPKRSFKVVTVVPVDCVAYTILFSNHMRLLKFLYVKCRRLYDIMEFLFSKLFFLLYKRV